MNPKPLKKMKTIQKIWGLLPMTVAALLLTACSSDDQTATTPQTPTNTSVQAQMIHYTVSVDQGEALTRATVDEDMKTLKFAAGDKLYVTGTNIQGVLDIDDGDGTTTGPGTASATFTGDLTYTGESTPANDLALTATLVSAQQSASLTTDNKLVAVDANGAVTVNYPTTAFCDDVATAVQKYSNLTGTSTYSKRSFALQQQTAFLNFEITFADGTATDTELSAVVNNNSSNICTANVITTTESEKVVAKFVLPVAKGTVLSSAKVTMGSKYAIGFGASQTLEGKVYNVKKTQYPMAANAIPGDVGKLICTDGHIHAYNADAACTKDRVAKIIYVGSSTDNTDYTNGLALALADENNGEVLQWKTAGSTCSGKNTSAAVTGASWMLPSKPQWETMINKAGSYSDLRDGFSSVGGENMQSDKYWSSTNYDNSGFKWRCKFNSGDWDGGYGSNADTRARACLVF